MLRPLRALLVLALLCVAAMSPASAFHPSSLPEVASATVAGNGGVAYRISAPEGASIDIEAFAASSRSTGSAAAVYLLAGDGTLRAALSVTVAGAQRIVRVEVPVLGAIVDDRTHGTGGSAGGALGAVLPAGEFIVIGAGLSNGSVATDVRLRASAGVAVIRETRGGGFFFREPDFTGGISVIAGTGTAAQAKAIAGSSVSAAVTGRLFGYLGANIFDAVSRLSYDGPDGGRGASTSGYFFFGSVPGTYRFKIEANVAASSLQALWAWGLDLVLP